MRIGLLVSAMLASDAAGVASIVLALQHESLVLMLAGLVGVVAALFAGFVLVESTT